MSIFSEESGRDFNFCIPIRRFSSFVDCNNFSICSNVVRISLLSSNLTSKTFERISSISTPKVPTETFFTTILS